MDWRLIRRLAQATLKNAAIDTSTFDVRKDCFEQQRTFLDDTADQIAVCTSRRAGKTSSFVRKIVDVSWKTPNSSCIYLNETRERAERTFWQELKQYIHTNNLPYTPHEGKLWLQGPENRWIFLGGGEHKKLVNRWKGILPKAAIFILDECQDWRPEILAHAYTEVIAPALADIGGKLVCGGVPGPLPDDEDTWFGWVNNPAFSTHGTEEKPWSIWDNPHVKQARQLMSRVMETRMVDESDPTIQREFFGRWVRDTQVLVFGALDDQLNAYDELPEGNYSFAAGVDFGYVDSSAINVLGWLAEGQQNMFVTRNDAFDKTGAYETIEKINTALSALGSRLLTAAADPAAGGKNICDDLWTRYGLEIEPATKDDKVGAIKLLASSIASREILIPRHHPLFRALRRVQWDPDHRGERLYGHTPDRVDALLYAFRAAFPHFYVGERKKPLTYEDERLERILQKQAQA